MNSFINTVDLLGDEVVAAQIMEKTITEFNDNVLRTVGGYSFTNCENLLTINLPNARSILQSSFAGCYSLKTAYLPSATSFGPSNFAKCKSLENVTLPAKPPVLSTVDCFFEVPTNCIFHIPAGSLAAYQAATNWSTITGQYTFLEDA